MASTPRNTSAGIFWELPLGLASTTEGYTDAPDGTDASDGLYVAVQLLPAESFSFFVGS